MSDQKLFLAIVAWAIAFGIMLGIPIGHAVEKQFFINRNVGKVVYVSTGQKKLREILLPSEIRRKYMVDTQEGRV